MFVPAGVDRIWLVMLEMAMLTVFTLFWSWAAAEVKTVLSMPRS